MQNLDKMNVKQVLEASTKHLAIMGKFSISDHVDNITKTFKIESLDQNPLHFELRYRNEESVNVDGNNTFSAYKIFSPKNAPDDAKAIPISGTALETILGNPDVEKTADLGGMLFNDLLNSLDKLTAFWHPNFDRLLSEGFFYWTQELKHNDAVFTPDELRHVLYNPLFNRSLLAYLRAGETDSIQILSAVKVELKAILKEKALVELIENQLPAYRQALNTEMEGNGLIEERFYQHYDGAEFLQNCSIPHYEGKKLPSLYRDFRAAAKKVEDISRCEPIIALIMSWYFSKFTQSTLANKITNKVYTHVYETSKTWKAVLSDKELNEDQGYFKSELDSGYADIENEKGKDSIDAIVFKLYKAEIIAHRQETWQPTHRYSKESLINDMVRRMRGLTAHTIEGIINLLNDGRKNLDKLHSIYSIFETIFNDHKVFLESNETKGKKLDGALLDQKILSQLAEDKDHSEWLTTFKNIIGTSEGTELANTFREQFNQHIAQLSGQQCKAFIDEAGKEIAKDIDLVGTLYRIQVEMGENTNGIMVSGGSSLGIRNPENDIDQLEEHGLKKEYRKRARSAHHSIAVKPEDTHADNLNDIEDDRIVVDKTSQTIEFLIDFSEDDLKEIKTTKGHIDMTELVNQEAEYLDRHDGLLEQTREKVLSNIMLKEAKAPARGSLRALLMGEFTLSAPGELSPLGKKDTSLGMAILLEMIEKIGATASYEGNNRTILTNTHVDLECGIADIDLPAIWQISKDKQGKNKLQSLVRYWQTLATEVFSVREYIEDMQEVKNLISLVRGNKEGYITFVNETVAEYNKNNNVSESFYCIDSDQNTPPPSVVFTSRQAFKGNIHSLAPFEQSFNHLVTTDIATGKNAGYMASYPLFVGNNLVTNNNDSDDFSPSFPAIRFHLPEISLFLCGLVANETFNEFFSTSDLKTLKEITALNIGRKEQKKAFFARYLQESDALGSLLLSKLSSSAFAQRCLKAPKARIDATDVLFDIVNNISRIVNSDIHKHLLVNDGNRIAPLSNNKGGYNLSDIEIYRHSLSITSVFSTDLRLQLKQVEVDQTAPA